MKGFCEKLRSPLKLLRVQLFFAYFLLFSLFFLAVSVAVGMVFRGVLFQQIGNSRLDVLRQISERANIVKTSSTTLTNLYKMELQKQDLLKPELSRQEEEELCRLLDEKSLVYNQVFEHVGLQHELVLLASNGFSYASQPEHKPLSILEDQIWYRYLRSSLLASPENTIQFSRTFQNSLREDVVYEFAVGCLLRQGDSTAVLMVLIDEKMLENLYQDTRTQDSQIYIYDQNGFIVSHSNKKMLGKQFIDVDYMNQVYGIDHWNQIEKMGENYLLTTKLDETTGWTIVEEIPMREILSSLDQVHLTMVLILAGGILLAMLVALYMSRRVSQPLTELSDAMDQFGSRDFTPLLENVGTQEIDHLRQSFNHMAGEIFHLMDAVQERERQKQQLEMNFLRAQINPHFLYNMLFSIRCTVEIGKNEQASQMLGAFIDLLRSTLAVKASEIPLQEEMESLKKYLVVQKLRYGEKVNYELDLQEGTEQCMVPPLILQPLVENAIFHGLEAKEEANMIIVSSTLHQQELLLTVTDDGAGMDEETLERVRQRIRQRSPEKSGASIGMTNVDHRIRLNYGNDYGLEIESTPEIGTTVTLRLPAVCNEEETRHESADC